MGAAVRALRYLVDTKHYVLRYDRRLGTQVEGFTDATWGSEGDGKSRGAFVFKLAGGAFSWSSKKQQGASLSSTEAEYLALSEGAREAVWLRMLLEECGQPQGAITLHCDNQSAIKLSSMKSKLSLRSKHIKIRYRFVQDALRDGDVTVDFVPTECQDADLLTKALDGPRHKDNTRRVGLVTGAGGEKGGSGPTRGKFKG
jgi:hypothetical protein